MKLETLFIIGILCSVLAAPSSHGQTFNVDGYMTDADSYTDKAAIYFFNGHAPNAYGDMDAPIYQTYVRWGQGKLSADPTGADYFFMYVETPVEVKNMVWGNVVTAADIAEYDVQYSTHHGDDPSMDYGVATGSEFMAFYDNQGKEQLKSGLQPDKPTGEYGMIMAKTSVDYLFGLGATEASSGDASVDPRNIGMAFEYQFALDSIENNALLDVVLNGGIIEYHLSPERGLVPTQVPESTGAIPEPTSALMAMMGSVLLLRRKR